MKSEAVIALANYEIVSIEHNGGSVRIGARYKGLIACPDCSSERLRSKGRYQRIVRHESWGMRAVYLILEARKWLCRACGCGFRQQFPGILKWQRASELFRRMIFFRHWDGINRRRLALREGIGSVVSAPLDVADSPYDQTPLGLLMALKSLTRLKVGPAVSGTLVTAKVTARIDQKRMMLSS